MRLFAEKCVRCGHRTKESFDDKPTWWLPERGEPSQPGDIYFLGQMLYYLLTSLKDDPAQQAMARMRIRERRDPNVEQFARVLESCHHHDWKQRPSALELLAAWRAARQIPRPWWIIRFHLERSLARVRDPGPPPVH